MTGRRRPLAVGLVALLLLGGCATGAPGGDRDPSPVRAAYLRYWDVWLQAGAGEAPADDLRAVTASRQLHRLRRALAEASSGGQVSRGTVGHRVRSIQVGRATAVVVDCVDLDAWLLYDRATGRKLPQLTDRPSQLATYWLASTPDGWRVTDSLPMGDC